MGTMNFLLLLMASVLLALGYAKRPCPKPCKCTIYDTDCSEQSLTSLPSQIPNTTVFLIATLNQLTSLHNDTFLGVPEVIKLFFDYNIIDSIETGTFRHLEMLEVIDLSSNKLTSLHPDIFPPKLYEVILNDNPLVVPQDTPFINSNNLLVLRIKYCNISNVPDTMFKGVPILIRLEMDYNNLKTVNMEALRCLDKLEALSFYENQLGVIDPDTFQYNPHLLHLELGSNSIQLPRNNSFLNAPKLMVLNLQANNISEVPSKSFENTPKIMKLGLHDNNINSFDQTVFSSVPDIVILDMRNNNVAHLNLDVFQNNPKLTHLFADENSLEPEQPQSIELPHLSTLTLRHCGLSRVPLSILKATPNIADVNLEMNAIGEVDVAELDGLAKLHTLNLKDNPVVCADCGHRKLWDWAKEKKIVFNHQCGQNVCKFT